MTESLEKFMVPAEAKAQKPFFYKCRWCPCHFCTRADLERHLETFGDRPHYDVWRELHWRVENSGKT
jgi:hypothetical protein